MKVGLKMTNAKAADERFRKNIKESKAEEK